MLIISHFLQSKQEICEGGCWLSAGFVSYITVHELIQYLATVNLRPSFCSATCLSSAMCKSQHVVVLIEEVIQMGVKWKENNTKFLHVLLHCKARLLVSLIKSVDPPLE